jgi:hypothetical protein
LVVGPRIIGPDRFGCRRAMVVAARSLQLPQDAQQRTPPDCRRGALRFVAFSEDSYATGLEAIAALGALMSEI